MGTKVKGLGIAEVIGDRRDEVIRIAATHGAFNVRVFGSVARGEATEESDVDFLVDWDYSKLSPWGSIGINDDLAELLGRDVDVGGADELHWFIRERVVNEALPL